MTRQNITLDPKDISETDTITFDFSLILNMGDTIVSASCVSDLFSGSDPAPGGVLSGAPQVVALTVLQQVTGGLDGNNYTIRCTITSAAGRVLTQSCNLPVIQI